MFEDASDRAELLGAEAKRGGRRRQGLVGSDGGIGMMLLIAYPNVANFFWSERKDASRR
jgi:hypothetical protein